ncbi:MAG: hypothetical protein QOJ39_3226 [Candidatus Eremiobacteraeota bacterium]|jgi:hypothetical protein|nr:hypothetical protein [Candidatus Eremiobacteraeota bacterium]
MIAFKQIRADAKAGAYEIRYRDLPAGTFVHHDERIGPGVTAGILADGEVFGIELLGLQPDTVTAARRYAAARGLAFPDDLPSLLAAS